MKKTLFKPFTILVFSLALGSGYAFAASEATGMKKNMDESMSEEMKTMDGDMKEMKEGTMDASHEMKDNMDKEMAEGMETMEGEMKKKPEMDTMTKN